MANYIADKQTQSDRVHTISEHIHGHGLVIPTLAAGVTVTGAAGAWTLGNFATLIGAGVITMPFDLHWINIETASADDNWELHLFAAAVEISRVRFTTTRSGNKAILPPFPCLMSIQPAGTQIQVKIANSAGGGEDVSISAEYHTY